MKDYTQKDVHAYVVTYNKPSMLSKNLTRLADGEDNLKITVIDNSDNQKSIEENLYQVNLKKDNINMCHDIEIINTKENLGGAYGFYLAVKDFMMNQDRDLIWLMDDDTLVGKQALNRLLDSLNYIEEHSGLSPAFLNSFVLFNDKEKKQLVPFYKNIPRHAISNIDLYNATKEFDYPIKFGTFTSFMTTRENIKKAGLPQKEYFVWGDDTEFSERLIYSTGHDGLLVMKSEVIHDTKENPKTVWSISDMPDDQKRIKYNYYGYRNRVISSYRRGGLASMYDTIQRQLIEVSNGVKELSKHDDLEYRDDMIEEPIKGIIDGLKMKDDFKVEKPWEDE